MKKMLLAVMAVMMSVNMMAQNEENANPERKPMDKTEMVKMRTDRMVKKYGLDDEQAAKLLELNTEYSEKMGPRMDRRRPAKPMQRMQRMKPDQEKEKLDTMKVMKPSLNMVAREDMQKARENYNAKLQEIMTEGQFKAYKEDEQKRHQEFREQRLRRPQPKE